MCVRSVCEDPGGVQKKVSDALQLESGLGIVVNLPDVDSSAEAGHALIADPSSSSRRVPATYSVLTLQSLSSYQPAKTDVECLLLEQSCFWTTVDRRRNQVAS